MFKVAHKKSYFACVELTNFQTFTQPISIFFQNNATETANSPETAARKLHNNLKIRHFVTCQIAFLTRYFKHKFRKKNNFTLCKI